MTVNGISDQETLSFNAYQEQAASTAVYPDKGTERGLEYVSLGLCGEAGSVGNQVKKIFRDDNGVLTPARKVAIRRQAGDSLWYLSQICQELGITLEELAAENLAKLSDRKDRGVIHGDGDNR